MVKVFIFKFPLILACNFGNCAFPPLRNIDVDNIIASFEIKEKNLITVFFFIG